MKRASKQQQETREDALDAHVFHVSRFHSKLLDATADRDP
jgi:hypothetical protein